MDTSISPDIIEERGNLARDYFKQGFNCCQSVVLAFKDVIGAETEVLERLSAGLGGGVGRMREVCGAVSGMAMVAGSTVPTDGKTIHLKKLDTYSLVQNLAARFREENGSIVCRELLGLRKDAGMSPVPQERNDGYYKTRPCEEMVACAARLLAGEIFKQGR